MLSLTLLKSKIPISRGGGVWWNQLSTFDAEFKFAKIQNSHFWGVGGGGRTNFQLLMLSSNLLKSKIPISGWVGGGGRTNFQLLMLSPNLLKKKKNFFAKNFLSFRTKSITVLFWTLSTKWFAYTKYRRTTKITTELSEKWSKCLPKNNSYISQNSLSKLTITECRIPCFIVVALD